MKQHMLRLAVSDLFAENMRQHGTRRYTVPSVDTYPYQWFWDSCFHAITLSYFDIERAQEEVDLLLASQFRNGMFPHIIYWDQSVNSSFPSIPWGLKQTSSLTQPPMLAAAAWRIYEETGDREWVTRVLPHLHAFHRYLFSERDPLQLSMAAIINPDESGEDNSPRFDAVLGLSTPRHRFSENFAARLELVDDWRDSRYVIKDAFDRNHWVYDLSFNSILAESLRLTALLAKAVDNPYIRHYSEHRSSTVRAAVRSHMLVGARPYSVYGPKLRPLKVETWASFMTLYAGVATQDEAESMVNGLLLSKRHYNTPYALPTVPLSEPSFDPDSDWLRNGTGTNWRGPVWIGANWFVMHGLLRYGYLQEATELYRDSQQLLRNAGFREYYDPLTGEGHGAHGFTWGGLILDMEAMIEAASQKPATHRVTGLQ